MDSLYWRHDPLIHQEKGPRELRTGNDFRLIEESLHEVQKGELLLLSWFLSLGLFPQEDFRLVLAEQAKGSVMVFKKGIPHSALLCKEEAFVRQKLCWMLPAGRRLVPRILPTTIRTEDRVLSPQRGI